MFPINVALQGVLDESLKTTVDRARFVLEASGGAVRGFEIFATPQFVFSEHDLVREDLFALCREYPATTLHVYRGDHPEAEYLDRFLGVADDFLDQGVALRGSVFHPGDITDISGLESLARKGLFVAAEVLGSDADQGVRPEEFDALFSAYSWLTMTLDTAHIMETHARGGPDLTAFARRFAPRVRQVHVSWSGNLYDPSRMEDDFDTNHCLLTLAPEPYPGLREALNLLDHPVITIEGVIPGSDYGKTLLNKETTLLGGLLAELAPGDSPI